MAEIDRIIHAPARLRIMSTLMALAPQSQVDFRALGKALDLTDGNLGAHLRALEDAGYIAVEKTFVARRPKTFVAASAAGRKAFAGHVAALQAIIKTS